MTEATVDDAPPSALPAIGELDTRLETYRVELTGYCYRILGSAFEAEDAVQETFIRAWRAYDRFEGRAALRSWLYKIATNVCFDMKGASQRRARPIDLNPASTADQALGTPLPESAWIEPVPDDRAVPSGGDPADVAVARESIRLAFVAALQHLPPRQRAVLILREVLRWKADEVAELLETSVASVNSALQRARATLASKDLVEADPTPAVLDDEQQALLGRYVAAFEQYDMDALTSLLNEDARWSMPPAPLWFSGRDAIAHMLRLYPPAFQGRAFKMVATEANGQPAAAAYLRGPGEAQLRLSAVIVLRIEAGVIAELITFGAALCAGFGLPPVL